MGLKIANNLIGGTEKMKDPAQRGAGLAVNCYPEHNGNNLFQASMPGLKLLAGLGVTGNIRGTFVPSVGQTSNGRIPDCFVAVGTRLYRINPDNSVDLVSSGLSNNTNRVTFAETGGVRALLLIADGANLFYYDLLSGTLNLESITLPTRISGNGTVTPSHVAVVGGSIVVNDQGSGYLYYSDAYPLNNANRTMFQVDGNGKVIYNGVTPQTATYTAKDHVFEDDYHVQQYFNGESSSDDVNGILGLGSALYIFGPKTVEIWQRGQGEYETWQRTSYTIQASNGLAAQYSVAHSDSTVFYLGSGESYGKAVMMAQGASFAKISEDWLDEKLLQADTGTSYGFCYSVGGHNFYVLQLVGLGETWVYDSTEKAWHQRTSKTSAADSTEVPWRVQGLAWFNEKFYAFCRDGGVYLHMPDYWKEDYADGTSSSLTRIRQTSVIVDDFRPFILEELSIECNVGSWEGYNGGTSPEIVLQISDDGGNTFSEGIPAIAGWTGSHSHRVRFLSLGMTRLCVIRVSFSEPCDFVMTSMGIRAKATMAVI